MKEPRKFLVAIFIIGILIRLTFLAFGAPLIYGDEIHLNNDSFSYTLPFTNLIATGEYTFDPTNPDAAYLRLPGYPLFWGIHSILFGEYANLLTSLSQILLDSLASILVFWIVLKISDSIYASRISGLIYSLNPFVIIWTPVIGTESIATFLTLLFFYILICQQEHRYYAIFLGLATIAAFYTRPYLGVLLPLGLLLIFLCSNIKKWKQILIVTSVFCLLYIPWPIRNYIYSGKIILLHGDTPGYYRYSDDINAARNWLHGWTTEVDHYLDKMTDPAEQDIFKYVSEVSSQVEGINEAILLGRMCGTGFHYWKYYKVPEVNRCDGEVARMFDELRLNYKDQFPLKYWVVVPFQNVKKFFFKSDLSSGQSWLFRVGLNLRSIGILISILGIAFYMRDLKVLIVATFPLFMLLFISFIIRQMEMRYMLQAEVVVLIFAGPALYYLYNFLKSRLPVS